MGVKNYTQNHTELFFSGKFLTLQSHRVCLTYQFMAEDMHAIQKHRTWTARTRVHTHTHTHTHTCTPHGYICIKLNTCELWCIIFTTHHLMFFESPKNWKLALPLVHLISILLASVRVLPNHRAMMIMMMAQSSQMKIFWKVDGQFLHAHWWL